jgi:hypothetical protein
VVYTPAGGQPVTLSFTLAVGSQQEECVATGTIVG